MVEPGLAAARPRRRRRWAAEVEAADPRSERSGGALDGEVGHGVVLPLRSDAMLDPMAPPSHPSMPAAFLGHGSPMNAVERQPLHRGLGRPSAPRCLAPGDPRHLGALVHQRHRGDRDGHPRTIHDFYGFPDGAVRRATTRRPVTPSSPRRSPSRSSRRGSGWMLDSWGIDHGTWSVLVHVFPRPMSRCVQLSINATKPLELPPRARRSARRPARQGVLVVGSGNVVHNLRRIDWAAPTSGLRLGRALRRRGRGADARRPGRSGRSRRIPTTRAVPTPDHFIPLLYLAGIAAATGEAADPRRRLRHGLAVDDLVHRGRQGVASHARARRVCGWLPKREPLHHSSPSRGVGRRRARLPSRARRRLGSTSSRSRPKVVRRWTRSRSTTATSRCGSRSPATGRWCCACTAGRSWRRRGTTRCATWPSAGTGRRPWTCAATAGSSAPPEIERYTLAELAGDVAAVAAALDDGPIVLVGHDWGAPIVWNTAIRHPDRVRAVAGLSVPYTPPMAALASSTCSTSSTPTASSTCSTSASPAWPRPTSASTCGPRSSGLLRPVRRRAAQRLRPRRAPRRRLPAAPARPARRSAQLPLRRGPRPLRGDLRAHRHDRRLQPLPRPRRSTPRRRRPRRRDRRPAVLLHRRLRATRCAQCSPASTSYEDPGAACTDFRGKTIIEGAGHWVHQEAPDAVNAALDAFLDSL